MVPPEREAGPAWEAGSCEGRSPGCPCHGCQCPPMRSVPGWWGYIGIMEKKMETAIMGYSQKPSAS